MSPLALLSLSESLRQQAQTKEDNGSVCALLFLGLGRFVSGHFLCDLAALRLLYLYYCGMIYISGQASPAPARSLFITPICFLLFVCLFHCSVVVPQILRASSSHRETWTDGGGLFLTQRTTLDSTFTVSEWIIRNTCCWRIWICCLSFVWALITGWFLVDLQRTRR